jgi:hypothetical protein
LLSTLLAEDLFLFSKLGVRHSRRFIERNLGFRFGIRRSTGARSMPKHTV